MEHERVVVHQLGIPDFDIAALLASVERVRTIVDGHIIDFAMESELAFGNAVAISSDEAGEIRLR